jgi:5-methylcytosine-specific restriction endonuclease McrA
VAVVNESRHVVFAAEIEHRGFAIKKSLDARRGVRRSRRNRHTRYRAPRFDNRRKPEGWLAPSLMSRVHNIETWVKRLQKFVPVDSLSLELVKFDMQKMANSEVSGVEYQQGELQGYEIREYLLEKWGRTCAYCGAKDMPLEVEHIIPKSRGGSDRASNLTIACHECNQAKGNQTAAEFGHPDIQAKALQPMKDAAAVNATRWALYQRLRNFNLPLEAGTGGRTKFNRVTLGLPKAHWIDAACVGESGARVKVNITMSPLIIRAMGHGSRQMCRIDKFGFPRTSPKGTRRVQGFKTGDVVKAIVPSGKKQGTHIGRVAVRSRGSFRVGDVDGVSHRYCRKVFCVDGYDYNKGDGVSSTR